MDTTHSPKTFLDKLLLAGVAVVLGVLFDYLFYRHIPGISFPLFIAFALVLLFVLHRYFGRRYGRLAVLSIVVLVFSVMVGIRASMLLTFLNTVLVFYLLLLLAGEAVAQRPFFRHFLIQNYVLAALVPLWHFVFYSLRTLGDLLSFQGAVHKRETSSQVLKGVVMALPVLVVFLLLFASADLAFQKYLNNLVHLNLPPGFVPQAVIIAIVALGSLGALAYVFMNRSDDMPQVLGEPKEISRIGMVQVSVFLGLIDALFLVFILFQLKYLFGGQYNIVQQGFTYAEYAHRGFAELILVALISLALITSAERYVDRRAESHSAAFKTVGLLLIVEVIVIMASAFKRLDIYQQAYGFTVLRFYVSAFIIWISALFLAFGYKIFRHAKDQFFAQSIFIGVIAFVLLMNLINPEAIIVRENIKHFRQTGKLDAAYFSQLSEDAVPAMMPLLGLPEGDTKTAVGQVLYDKWQSLQKNNSWQETNWSRSRANNLLDGRAAELMRYVGPPDQNETH